MNKTGVILKMIAHCDERNIAGTCNISYSLPIGKEKIPMNSLIGERIDLVFKGEIHCLHCGSLTKKSYGQ